MAQPDRDISDGDIAVIGCGAAGLTAAIHAARASLPDRDSPRSPVTPTPRIFALDGARRLGAKILVAGGGRCNVTHHAVDESAYAGSSRNAIRNVLRRFDVPETVRFFAELGVELKREETGKLFPTTDDAHTVLNALLDEARRVGVEIVHPWRVGAIRRDGDAFLITRAIEDPDASRPAPSPTNDHDSQTLPPDDRRATRHAAAIRVRRVILATGGKSLPKTGSDGAGYALATSLGHTLTPRVFPALVPLTLPKGHFLCELSGITLPARLELRSPTGKKLVSFTDSTLFTHVGLSGPSVLDISRYYLDARADAMGVEPDPGGRSAAMPRLLLGVMPEETLDSIDRTLAELGRTAKSSSVGRFLSQRLPERLAAAICTHARVDPSSAPSGLSRDARRALAAALTELDLPITGDRGFLFAEVTAGGVPLAQLHPSTMESRSCPGLHLCGEICDVDGRIGGFNFQWAWASGFVAGSAAAKAILSETSTPDAPPTDDRPSRSSP